MRFGEYLTNNNKININQLTEALHIQKNQLAKHHKMLGEILVHDVCALDTDEMFSLLKYFNQEIGN